MKLWYIGNTSVRSAFRLRDGLLALADSPLQGRMRGQEGDKAFRDLLGRRGVVSLGEDASCSVGRKWRSALGKCGFLYPAIPKSSAVTQDEVGPADCITPSGRRLMQASTVPAMQECFLRALAAQYLPSEEGEDRWFSPLRHTLAVLLEVEELTGSPSVSFIELALFVQTSWGGPGAATAAAKEIAAFRLKRDRSANRRRFDSQKYEEAARASGRQASTFRDYADANIRYLKATGLLQSKGRGVCLVPEKRLFAQLMAKDISVPETELMRYQELCKGAPLPTDHKGAAMEVLQDLLARLFQLGIPFGVEERSLETPEDISLVRHEIEEIIARHKEEEYAKQQREQWQEIAAYLDLIASRKERCRLGNGNELFIPRGEAPAYLEWTVWRAFLAAGGLVRPPYEARRFPIDQDFLPVGTAPGNGPDLVMEFEDFVLAAEVTLSESSRQEAMEGEPVRRHVADLVTRYGKESEKPVYGLFLANRIDSNTAETFRIGVWYTREDQRMQLHIVPLTIPQFSAFFRAMFQANRAAPMEILRLLERCGRWREGCEAPRWKEKIGLTVAEAIGEMGGEPQTPA